MDIDWTSESVGGVTLVSVRLRNHRAVPRRVRLRNRLDGPVLPPRRQREPEAGWDRSGVSAVVPARSTTACGYACPATLTEHSGSADEAPVEIVDVHALEDAEKVGDEKPIAEGSVSKAIRRLGDARPPRAVLGEPVTPNDGAQFPSQEPPERDTEQPAASASQNDKSKRSQQSALSPDVDERLNPYRNRIQTVEALSLASVSESTAVLDTTGGIVGLERMGTALDADAASLRALAAEATALAARAEAATPPLGALRRLS